MQRTRSFVTAACALLVLSACADESPIAPEAAPARVSALGGLDASVSTDAPSRHLVVFKGRSPKGFESSVAALGGRVIFVSDVIGAAGVEGLDGDGLAAVAAMSGVDTVEGEPLLPLAEPVSVSAPEGLGASPDSPSDPSTAYFFPRQWDMRAIQADVAWAAGRTGSSDVTVAILDTGIGYMHPDLQGRVDLSRSASFDPVDDLYVAFYFPGVHPIADIGYHGTHVAATVASNGLAAAGVTSGVTLIGAKVCSVAQGGCPGLAVTQGILHAIENGADVANMSLGGWFSKSDYPGYVSVINRLFNYAKQNDVTFVVSAGNEALDLDHDGSGFKTYCDAPHVLCVAATGPTSGGTTGPWPDVDTPSYYTNYGRSAIDVAAPGGNFGAAIWAACSPTSLIYTICGTGTYVLGISGTSMAAPHVSGLAALGVEDVGKKPSLVRAYVRNSADAIGGGNTAFYGTGRINVAKATGTN